MLELSSRHNYCFVVSCNFLPTATNIGGILLPGELCTLQQHPRYPILVGCDRRRIIALDTRNGTHQVLHESNEIIRISCLSPKSGDIISSLVNQQHGYLSNFFIFHWIWHVKTLCVSDILTFYDILTCYDVSTFFIRKFSLCSRDHQDEWL